MIEQCEAKIFLAKDRSITTTGWMKSCALFKQPAIKNSLYGNFYNVQDDVLSSRRTLNFIAENDADLIILPVAGSIIYNDNYGNSAMIEGGKMQYFSVKKNTQVKIFNPYNDVFVNFLRIWLKPGSLNAIINTASFSFERENNKNKLLHLFVSYNNEQQPVNFYIGKFDGRKDVLHKVCKPGNMVFIFVIDGAFEVQYRLLETRDALALWNVDKVDMEALSNNAVVLMIDMPATA
ncbi:pirin family protein [Parafilimonas terrae]|jgi:hypothetical protein|uniref:Quercetin 2,3-dioxygenase C-terminal cupin domain-containing protein n=1 Tax=Parafilimonas terrae TaxID=1465490 RepID=A0A1I5VS21_9BACT|nr:hypothetical protein [Parafilimonas terrae]SFQ10299.1 hypothetical protein SAMN05444277_105156 [Parafilimonas terrae]